MSPNATRATVDAVFRIESPRLVARLTRLVRDVGLAEELAQDALVAALEHWPETGVPENPAAWLVTTAKNRALDRLASTRVRDRKHAEIEHLTAATTDPEAVDDALDETVGDDLLRLVFVACHPVLSVEAQVALTLRLLGGLTTDEIARAFLTSEPTIAQRIVRAKRTLSEARVPFEVPRGPERIERLSAVLGVVYLIFNEGYSATSGDDWVRPALCEDALRLGRVLVGLLPGAPEVHGLVALMEIQASRNAARVAVDGSPVLLLEQDRRRWDHAAIGRGLEALARALAQLGVEEAEPGPFVLQAEIAACHARALVAEDTDWRRIAALYAALAARTPSPVIELNRAVAVGMAEGAAAGLAVVDAIRDHPALRDYHLLRAVRGDLLAKLGRGGEARIEFEEAAALTRNAREQALLRARAERCG